MEVEAIYNPSVLFYRVRKTSLPKESIGKETIRNKEISDECKKLSVELRHIHNSQKSYIQQRNNSEGLKKLIGRKNER